MKEAILLFTAGVDLFLGLFVYFQNKRSIVNKTFLLFTIGVFGWILSIFLAVVLSFNVLFWGRLAFVFSPIIAGGLNLFIVNFFPDADKKFKYQITVIFLIIFFSIVSFTPLIVKEANVVDGFLVGKFGVGYAFHNTFIILIILLSIWKIIYNFLKSKGIFKLHSKYLLLGVGFFLIPALLTNAILPVVGIKQFNTLGPLFSIFMIGFLSYAIVKHRLMGIEITIQTALFWIILLAFSIWAYAFTNLSLESFLGPESVRFSRFVASTVFLAIILNFRFFQGGFKRWTGNYLFKHIYNYSDTMRELSHILKSSIDLLALFEKAFSVFQKTIRFHKFAALLHNDTPHFYVQTNIGFGVSEDVCVWFNGKIKSYLQKECGLIVAQEIEYDLATGQIGGPERKKSENLLSEMNSLGAAVIAPIFIKDRLIGAMVCGDKEAKDAYTYEDLKLLETFCHSASIAIENARLYYELKLYNQTLEKRVRERTLELQNLYDSQSRFLADISHEFQTPLAIIKGNADILKSKPAARIFKKAHKAITDTVERLSNIVVNIVSLFKADTHREKLIKEKIRLDEILEDICDEFAVLAEDRDLVLVLNTEEAEIFGDKQKIKEIFMNLTGNAIKYTPAGGKIDVNMKKEKNWIVVTVLDNGLGMAKENLPYLFDRFYRLKNNKVGTGIVLGLSLTAWMVKVHDGAISVESDIGKGTMFTVKFPLAKE